MQRVKEWNKRLVSVLLSTKEYDMDLMTRTLKSDKPSKAYEEQLNSFQSVIEGK